MIHSSKCKKPITDQIEMMMQLTVRTRCCQFGQALVQNDDTIVSVRIPVLLERAKLMDVLSADRIKYLGDAVSAILQTRLQFAPDPLIATLTAPDPKPEPEDGTERGTDGS